MRDGLALGLALGLLGCAEPQAQPQMQPTARQVGQADDSLPPVVLSGEAELHCNISSRANGRQTLKLKSGQGLEFDAVVSPILDGVVEARGPERGGEYRFTSHLAGEANGTLSGVGEVAVGAVDRRPLGSRLDQTFAYAGLLTPERPRRTWVAALALIRPLLSAAPPGVAGRASALDRELAALRAELRSGAPLAPLARRARPLRAQLARLAADWAGAANTAVAEPARAAR
jgi:hypothetical protein